MGEEVQRGRGGEGNAVSLLVHHFLTFCFSRLNYSAHESETKMSSLRTELSDYKQQAETAKKDLQTQRAKNDVSCCPFYFLQFKIRVLKRDLTTKNCTQAFSGN